MSQRLLFGFAPLVAVVSIVAAGCGSSSKSSVYATKADFAKAMNTLCAQANASAKVITAGGMQTMAQVASVGPRFIAADQSFADQLGKLQPPADLKPHVTRFISTIKEAIDLFKPVVAAAKNNNSVAFSKAAAAATYQNQSEKAAAGFEAKAIGAPACAAG